MLAALMAKARKKQLLTVRVSPEVLRDFNKTAEILGASMSTLVHQYVVRTIRETRQKYPDEFELEGKIGRVPVAQPANIKDRDHDTASTSLPARARTRAVSGGRKR
jgi:hypothetical protein